MSIGEADIQSATKNKANYSLAQRHQSATKPCKFWHSDLRDNCKSCLPPHLRTAHTW